jgi:hypothetical protein
MNKKKRTRALQSREARRQRRERGGDEDGEVHAASSMAGNLSRS